MRKIFTFILIFFQVILFAQSPVLVTDLNLGDADAFPFGNDGKSVTIGNTTLLVVQTEETGEELGYLRNGNFGILKDITPGEGSTSIRNLTEFRNNFYFTTYSWSGISALWKSDGTEEGTQIFSMNQTNSLVISEDNFLYYYSEDAILRTDGETIDTIFNGAEFSYSHQPSDNNMCKYNEGIAFIRQNGDDDIELYFVENGVTNLIATNIASSYAKIYGLNQVGENLLFIQDEPFNDNLDGSYQYNAVTNSIESYTIDGKKISRLHDFTSDLALAHVYQSGFYTTNGVSGEELMLAPIGFADLAQGDDIIRAKYQDKMILAVREDFAPSHPVILTDGTSDGTTTLHTGRGKVPTNILVEGKFAFYFYEYGFWDHRLAYVNLEDGTTGVIHDFDDAGSSFKGFPVAVQDGKIYFAAKIQNSNVGLELYSLDLELSVVSTSQPELLSYSVSFTNESFTVLSENYSQAEVEIFSTSGVLLEKRMVSTNSPISVAKHHGFIILRFNVDGEITTRKFIRR